MFDYIEIRLTCEEQGCMLCVKKHSHAQWRDFKMNVLVCDDDRKIVDSIIEELKRKAKKCMYHQDFMVFLNQVK